MGLDLKLKLVLPALLLGSVLAFAPGWILKLPSDTGLIGELKWFGSYISVPGGFVGLIASGAQIDDINFVVVDLTNFVFYSALAYVLLGVWEQRRTRARSGLARVQRSKS